jgi:WD40 repeat protein
VTIRHRALLIGNATFSEDPALPNLHGPINDVYALRSAIQDVTRGGLFIRGDVTILAERMTTEIIAGLDAFFTPANPEDVLLLYYSGHGRLDENGILYLCARDTLVNRLRSTAVSSRQINDIIDSSPATRIIILLDCCYSGAFKGADISLPIAGRGRFVIAACGATQLAYDASTAAAGSPFAETLVRGLQGGITRPRNPGVITIEDIYEYLHQQFASQGIRLPNRRFAGEGHFILARHMASDALSLQPRSEDQYHDSYAAPWGLTVELRGHTDRIWDITFSPKSSMVASGSDDRTVRLWNGHTGSHLRTLTGHTLGVWSVSFSPTGQILASSGMDKTVQIWNAHTGERLQTLTGHTRAVQTVAFSPTNPLLASAGNDSTIRLWNIETGEWLRTLTGHVSGVIDIAFSPDGNLLASCSTDKTVRLWSPNTRKEIRILEGHTDGVWSVAFNRLSPLLASSSIDGTVRLWNSNTGELVRIMNSGHNNLATSVAFCPVGTLLASSSSDGTVQLWNWSNGQHVRSLTGHKGIVTSVTFSQNGALLASSGEDKTVRIRRAISL